MVAFITLQYANDNNMSDIFQVGVVDLIKAIDTFKLEKGNKFSTYAVQCIKNEINMFLRKSIKILQESSFEEAIINNRKGDSLNLIDILEDKSQDFVADLVKRNLNQRIRILFEDLLEREKKIANMAFGFEGRRYTQEEIAEILGVSQSLVSRLIKKIVLTFKKKLVKEGYIEVRESTGRGRKK